MHAPVVDHSRKQDSVGWEGIRVYDCSRVFVIVSRSGDLFIFEFLAVN